METLEESPLSGSDGMDYTALRAGFAGVMRINVDNPNTVMGGFVVDKGLELPESPIIGQPIQGIAFSPAFDGYALPDSVEVFQHNTIPFTKWFNYLLAYPVVDISHKPCLPARDSFEFSPGRTSAFGLKNPPQPIEFSELPLNSLEELIVAGYCKIVYSDINTNNFMCATVDVDVSGNNHMQEQITFSIDKVCCSDSPTKILQEVSGNLNRDFESAFDGAETHHLGLEGEGSGIIANTKEFFNLRLGRLLFHAFSCPNRFKHLIRLISAAYDKLSGQVRQFTDGIICRLVKLEFPKACTVSNINHMLGGWEYWFMVSRRTSCTGSFSFIVAHVCMLSY